MKKEVIDNIFDVYKLRITEILSDHSEVLEYLQKDEIIVPICKNEVCQAWLKFDDTHKFVINGTFQFKRSPSSTVSCVENFTYNPDSGLSLGDANIMKLCDVYYHDTNLTTDEIEEISRDIIAPELDFVLLNWSPIERLIQDKIEVYKNNFVERMYTINACCGYNSGYMFDYITLSGRYKGIPNIVIRQFKDIPNQSVKIVFLDEEYLGPTLVVSGDMGLALGNSDRFYSRALKELCERGDIDFIFELIDEQSNKLVSTIEVRLHKN